MTSSPPIGTLLAGTLLAATLLVGQAAAQDYAEQQRRAAAMLDALDAGDYETARANFDDTVKAALGAERLRQVWEALPKQMGPAKERGPAYPEQINGLSAVVTPLHYGLATLDALITFDANDRINGFRLVPGKQPAAPPQPAPADAAFTESELRIGSADRGLPGTLSLPRGAGPFPVVVLVAGSGPLDRDSSIGPNKPLRDLAHGLAAHGIAVLRFDKRTYARPQDFRDGDQTIDAEVTDDALAALTLLRASAVIDPRRVFVLGHSLGAMMAPRIAQRDPAVAGLILLAPPSRPLEDAIVAQVTYLAQTDGAISTEEQASIDLLKAQRERVRALRPGDPAVAANELPLNVPAPYWLSLRGYDPVAVATELPQPLLVLRGERDYQVTAEEFARWQLAYREPADRTMVATFKQYPALNHLFMAGEGPSLPAEYATPCHVDAAVIADIAAWIAAH